MDQRHRVQRAVIDPKVRQVGFFAPNPNPNADIPACSSPPLAGSPSNATSSSPVIIIPPPPPPAARNHGASSHLVVGSYDAASDSLLGTSPPLTSPPPSSARGFVVDGEFSDESWLHRSNSAKFASSFPRGGFNLTAAKAVIPPEGDAFPAVVPRSENNEASALEANSEQTDNSRPLKAKLTKSERRALQESQRAAKAATKGAGNKPSAGTAPGGPGKAAKHPSQKKDTASAAPSIAALEKKGSDRLPEKDRKKDVPAPRMQFDDKSRVEKAKRRAVVNQTEARNRVELFRHLPQYEHGTQLPDLESKFFQLDPMHPAIYKVGLQYLSGELTGGNGRCIAMLQAFQEAVKDYVTPPEKTLTRDLTTRISSYISFLNECRPLSVSMGNAIRFVKNRIAKMQITLSESEAKALICYDIDRFISEKIILAEQVIVKHATTKIRDGDVLLTYGSSCVVEMILLHAHELGKKFRVVVVDSRPKLEGQRLLRRLVTNGLNCTYTHINAVSYTMHEVSKVLLGAASVLSNGTVYSRVGTASVAMVANSLRVPVLICCEAYKFHERVQLDSICFNELGDPDCVSKVSGRLNSNYLYDWGNKENLQLLNLMYDVMPSDYVSMIVTDYGMIPPTSVPVIVREYRKEQLWM